MPAGERGGGGWSGGGATSPQYLYGCGTPVLRRGIHFNLFGRTRYKISNVQKLIKLSAGNLQKVP